MKALLNISLAFLAVVTLTASAAIAGEYDWKQKITYANSPLNKSTSTASRSCATQPYGASRWAYSYELVQVETRRASPYERAASLKVGDKPVVTAATANLKIGDRVVGMLARGQHITVLSIEGPWVGTNVEQNGRNVGGWILASDLGNGTNAPLACR